MKHWLVRVLIATNQLGNALTGGDPQMSFSARFGFARERGSEFAKLACGALEKLDHHHWNPEYNPAWDHCDIALVDYWRRKSDVRAK